MHIDEGLPPENLLTAALVPAQHVESVAQCQDRAGTYMACSCGGAEVRCVAFRLGKPNSESGIGETMK